MKKLLFFFILLILLIGFAPRILSTHWGNKLLIALVESRVEGDFEAEKITLRWLEPQEAKGIRFTSPQVKASAEQIVYGDDLISLLRKEIPKNLSIEKGKFDDSDIQIDFKNNQVDLSIKNALLPEGDRLSLKLKGDFATGVFTISEIEYKDIPIKTITGTWEKKKFTAKGLIGTTPFTLTTKLRVTLKELQVKEPILLDTPRFKGSIDPFIFFFEKGLNKPLTFHVTGNHLSSKGSYIDDAFTFDFQYWGIEGKLTTKLREKSGPIALTFSKGVQGSLNGQLTNGVLQLKEDLKLQLLLTKDLITLIYQNFDIKLEKPSQPFTLAIAKQGFSLPLLPYNSKEFEAKKGKLDLGKFTLNDAGLAATINQFLELKSSGEISFWFAPLDFSIQKGKIAIERTDFLMQNAYHLATWGTTRLPKRRVSMILGITAEVLAKRFSLDNLPDSYLLQIPFKGDFGKVKLDTKKASERIAWLIARKKIAPEAGGNWGQIFSDLTDVAEPTSPPPKKLFPWQ